MLKYINLLVITFSQFLQPIALSCTGSEIFQAQGSSDLDTLSREVSNASHRLSPKAVCEGLSPQQRAKNTFDFTIDFIGDSLNEISSLEEKISSAHRAQDSNYRAKINELGVMNEFLNSTVKKVPVIGEIVEWTQIIGKVLIGQDRPRRNNNVENVIERISQITATIKRKLREARTELKENEKRKTEWLKKLYEKKVLTCASYQALKEREHLQQIKTGYAKAIAENIDYLGSKGTIKISATLEKDSGRWILSNLDYDFHSIGSRAIICEFVRDKRYNIARDLPFPFEITWHYLKSDIFKNDGDYKETRSVGGRNRIDFIKLTHYPPGTIDAPFPREIKEILKNNNLNFMLNRTAIEKFGTHCVQ